MAKVKLTRKQRDDWNHAHKPIGIATVGKRPRGPLQRPTKVTSKKHSMDIFGGNGSLAKEAKKVRAHVNRLVFDPASVKITMGGKDFHVDALDYSFARPRFEVKIVETPLDGTPGELSTRGDSLTRLDALDQHALVRKLQQLADVLSGVQDDYAGGTILVLRRKR
jgi:hypothetical protein